MAYFDTPYGYGYHHAAPGRIAGQSGNMTLYDVLDCGYDLGLSDYPIYDESKRKWLNDMVIDHFMFREIGAETPTMFIYYLNRTMREGMPPINLVFEFIDNVDADALSRTNRYTAESSGESTSKSDGSGHSYASTNPRQTMVGKDPTNYYDSGTFSDSTSTGENGSTGHNEGASYSTLPGDAMTKWVTGVNNAIELVFDLLEPCFSHIWADHVNTF